MTRILAALILAAFALPASAQAPAPRMGVRGTAGKLESSVLTVKLRDGKLLRVALSADYAVVGVSRARLEDLAAGKYIGTTTVGERNGALVAVEVHIFPESMRGVGEGHRATDRGPGSRMTNASVADIESIGTDRVLTVTYKGGERKVLVPPTAAIVAFVPAGRELLKPGAKIFCVAERRPDGSLAASRVYVGTKGLVPPM